MPYLLQVFKTHPLNTRPWSNDYKVDTSVLDTAIAALALVYSAETGFHNASTTFTHAVVSDLAVGSDVFSSVPLNSPGERSDPGDNYPLWNTLRVDITAAGGGRPGRKFYRLPLGEGDVTNYVVASGLRGTIKTALDGLIADLTSLGAPWVIGTGRDAVESFPQVNVQMRQLHRKRRHAPAV